MAGDDDVSDASSSERLLDGPPKRQPMFRAREMTSDEMMELEMRRAEALTLSQERIDAARRERLEAAREMNILDAARNANEAEEDAEDLDSSMRIGNRAFAYDPRSRTGTR